MPSISCGGEVVDSAVEQVRRVEDIPGRNDPPAQAAKQASNSLCLRPPPGAVAHGFDDRAWGDMVEVAGGGGDGGVAKLAGDDRDVHSFGAELRRVGVAKTVGVDALVDARAVGQALEEATNVSVGQSVAPELPEYLDAQRQSRQARLGLPTWRGIRPWFR